MVTSSYLTYALIDGNQRLRGAVRRSTREEQPVYNYVNAIIHIQCLKGYLTWIKLSHDMTWIKLSHEYIVIYCPTLPHVGLLIIMLGY